MRKLIKFKNGQIAVTNGISISLNGERGEEFDADELTEKETEELYKNPKSKKFDKKLKKI